MLKKETRILGLSGLEVVGNRILVIGVIFRGNRWLDGIIACSLRPRNSNDMLPVAQAIIACKQYSQIRAVILRHEQRALGTSTRVLSLSNKINLPVIAIISYGPPRTRGRFQRKKRSSPAMTTYYRVKVQGKSLSVLTTKLSITETSEILSLACVKGSVFPEAVRIARLVAHSVSKSHILQTAKGSVNLAKPQPSNA